MLPPPGATACLGCHPAKPSVTTPVVPLFGQSAENIVAKLRAFRNGEQPYTVMDRIAKGIGEDEAQAIAGYFARGETK